jgi:hypothetical protein
MRYFFFIVVLAACDPAPSLPDGAVIPDLSEPSMPSMPSMPSTKAMDGSVDPCGGVVCNQPPSSSCVSDEVSRSYSSHGTCSDGQCSYPHTDSSCANGCVAGACQGIDLCNGVSCDSPPASTCSDPHTLLSYSASGSCSLGVCSYPSSSVACANGCQAGACLGDPCAGVTCDSPPGSFCVGTQMVTLRSFGASGTCHNGSCSYPFTDTNCPNGCVSGMCLGDPCLGVTCTQPPLPTCSDAQTLRTWSSPGSCSHGGCSYTSSDMHCPNGCKSGACCTPESDAELCAAHSATCGALTVTDRCGASRQIASCGSCSGQLTCNANSCSCAWTSELVASGADVLVDNATMVLDANGVPQIRYYNSGTGLGNNAFLVFTQKVNGKWTESPLGSPGVVSYYGGMAADASGDLHVVYEGMYYRMHAGTWSSGESYTAMNERSQAASILVGSDGTLHVAYIANDLTASIRYAKKTASGWTQETIESPGPSYTTYDDSIAIGFLPGNVLAVAWPGSSQIRFASRGASGWSAENVAPDGGDYTRVSMEIDGTGVVRLTYSVGFGAGQLAVKKSGVWSTTNISGWSILPPGFPAATTMVTVSYTNVNSPTPLVIMRQNGSGFSSERVIDDTGNSSLEATIFDSQNLWILMGGYQALTLYHRCVN